MDADTIEVRWAGEVVARHTLADPAATGEVWDAGHFQAAQAAALGRSRGRHLALVLPDEAPPAAPVRLEVQGDVDVEVPDLARYETGGRP